MRYMIGRSSFVCHGEFQIEPPVLFLRGLTGKVMPMPPPMPASAGAAARSGSVSAQKTPSAMIFFMMEVNPFLLGWLYFHNKACGGHHDAYDGAKNR